MANIVGDVPQAWHSERSKSSWRQIRTVSTITADYTYYYSFRSSIKQRKTKVKVGYKAATILWWYKKRRRYLTTAATENYTKYTNKKIKIQNSYMSKRWEFKYHTVLNQITRPRPTRLGSLVTEATSKKNPKLTRAAKSCPERPRDGQSCSYQ